MVSGGASGSMAWCRYLITHTENKYKPEPIKTCYVCIHFCKAGEKQKHLIKKGVYKNIIYLHTFTVVFFRRGTMYPCWVLQLYIPLKLTFFCTQYRLCNQMWFNLKVKSYYAESNIPVCCSQNHSESDKAQMSLL